MCRFIDLPARGDLPAASLFARISTPHERSAKSVDPDFPTLLLCHPLWTDSFIFYPQFDEPAFSECWNIVCLDMRGHGETVVEPFEGSPPFTWWDAADDAYLALRKLGVESVHVAGASLATILALRLTQKYPGFVSSLSLIDPASETETEDWASAFDDCKQLLTRAILGNDAEALEDVTVGSWAMGIRQITSSIKQLRERFIDHQRTKLLDGRLLLGAPYLTGLLDSRTQVMPDEGLAQITCPVIVIYSSEIGPIEKKGYERLVETINTSRPRKGLNNRPAQAIAICIEDAPRWLTLTLPDIVHPLLFEHLTRASTLAAKSLPPSPISVTFSRSSRTSFSSMGSPRRTSSPREMTGFEIPPPPKAGPGVLTLGQVLDQENAEGIPVTVEVSVTVQEVQQRRE